MYIPFFLKNEKASDRKRGRKIKIVLIWCCNDLEYIYLFSMWKVHFTFVWVYFWLNIILPTSDSNWIHGSVWYASSFWFNIIFRSLTWKGKRPIYLTLQYCQLSVSKRNQMYMKWKNQNANIIILHTCFYIFHIPWLPRCPMEINWLQPASYSIFA